MSKQKEFKFHVVELMDPPSINPEKYICVPNSWIRLRETSDGPALVKFPVEDLSETKKRVVFLANVKYSTNSFTDARNYIKILNKIFDQEQSSTKMVEDVTPKSDADPVSEEIPMQLDLSKAGGIICRKNSQVETTDSPPPNAKRYFTRQSLRIPSSSNNNNTVSLPDDTTKKDLPSTSHCVENSDKTNNNQENEQSANNTSELMRKWQIITAFRAMFGDNFKEMLEQLHSKYEHNQLVLEKMQLAFKENCRIIKTFIELTDEAKNALSNSDLDSAVKELENSMMEVNINESKSDKPTGYKVQNATRKEEKKHSIGNTEAKKNNPLNKIRGQSRKFTLPPEYDPNDSRWTLKHREMKRGLVELLPYSRIYIDAVQLSNCKITSKDSKTLTRALLLEIFTENALSVCSPTGKKANAFELEGTSVRPGLDQHARTVLLNYVKKHAAEKNWVEVDSQLISNTIRNKMQDIRGKHQNIVEK